MRWQMDESSYARKLSKALASYAAAGEKAPAGRPSAPRTATENATDWASGSGYADHPPGFLALNWHFRIPGAHEWLEPPRAVPALGAASLDEPRATRAQSSPRSTGARPPARHAAVSIRRSYTDRMSAMREELHHLVDELPEEEVRPVLELIRGRADASHSARDLPFFASFEADPDLAERSEEILRAELGR
jgi:hypothetical protein